ncbi:probable aquaporin SIP2-1 isoform X2 [Populus nigra]|uniref:probable aquaporin SIP2-1 isoform X2 n=1 Tax=Populus nigra TaxID=3691 RepID=UPI002B266311|nr:probable aquaporin SIP2-1 isoform X2 [Populus nigra]
MHKQLTQSKNLNKSKNPSPKTLTHKKVSIFFFYKMVSKTRLIVSDFIVSIIWVWNGALIKMFVFKVLQMGHDSRGEFMRQSLTFLFTIGTRIPAQVIGSITAVRLLIDTFPEIGRGPRLNVDIHKGALTEGLLAFGVVTISLGLARKIPGSFFMKTWISSISKLSLHILGSDLTGGCMNPASVMGWAYARGDHITKEHILVYWLAPIQGALLAAYTFKLLFRPQKQDEKEKLKGKTD